MYYTDDVVDFEDLFMHLTVHCSLKCLGMDANGGEKTKKNCSSDGSKLHTLFFFLCICVPFLNSNCFVMY